MTNYKHDDLPILMETHMTIVGGRGVDSEVDWNRRLQQACTIAGIAIRVSASCLST